MSFETNRVTEVFTNPDELDDGKARYGSGYFLTGTIVLTAKHVVGDVGSKAEVLPLDTNEWLSADVLWRGVNCDAALLEVSGLSLESGSLSLSFGRVPQTLRLQCRSVGFPRAQKRGKVRDSEELVGVIAPLTGFKSRQLTVIANDELTANEEGSPSPWEGMSGAALFSGPLLIGLIVVDLVNFKSPRLMAEPITALLEEEEFRNIIRKTDGDLDLNLVDAVVTRLLPGEVTVANFRYGYLGDPGHPIPFGGRDQELDYLDTWLNAADARHYLLLTAPPGRGKSALLVRWLERLSQTEPDSLEIVFVPVSIRYNLNKGSEVFRALVARLAALRGEVPDASSVEEWRDLFSNYLRRSSPARRRVLVVLDGIDEASDWSIGPSLFPSQVPEGLRVVVSARLTANRSTSADWLSEFGWDDGMAESMTLDPLSVEGTRDVLLGGEPALRRLAATDGVVERLHALSQGDPLVLGLYLRTISKETAEDPRKALELLSHVEPGIAGYMTRWWEDQVKLWGKSFSQQGPTVAHIFNLLACARGPLDRRELIALAGRTMELDGDVLDDAARVLDRFLLRLAPSSFAVSHPLLADFRRGVLRSNDELGQMENIFVAWGAETLDALRNDSLRPDMAPNYLVRHYGQHLKGVLDSTLELPKAAEGSDVSVDDPPPTLDRLFELTDPAWRAAWEAVGQPDGYVNDVELAWRAAANANFVAASQGRRASYVAKQISCQLALAHIRSGVALMNGSFAAALVRHRVWSERRALGWCANIESAFDRAEALAALASSLGVDCILDALELLPDLAAESEGEDVAPALAAIVRRLIELDEIGAAHALVHEQEPGYVHAIATFALIPGLADDERTASLKTIRDDLHAITSIGNEEQLLELLGKTSTKELALEAFGDPPANFLAGQIREISDWWPADSDLDSIEGPERAYAVSFLAPWLTAADLETQVPIALESLSEGRDTFAEYRVHEVLRRLAPYLGDESWERALLAVDELFQEAPAKGVLGWIALQSADGDSSKRLRRRIAEELGALLNHSLPSETVAALRLLGEHAEGHAVLSAIDEHDDRAWGKADFVEAIAPYLDKGSVDRALSNTRHIRRETRTKAVRALLARWASFGPKESREALAWGTDVDVDEAQTAVLIFNHADAPRLDIELLARIEDRSLRLAAAAASSRQVSLTAGDFRSLVLLSLDERDVDDHLTLELFDELQRSLPDSELSHADAVATLEKVIRQEMHPRKDLIVLRYLRRLASVAGPAVVIDIGTRLSSASCETPVALAIVASAHELRSKEALADAQQTVERMSDPAKRAVARAAILGLLPSGEQEEAWAVVVAELGRDPIKRRCSSIALILKALPEHFRERAIGQLVPDAPLEGHRVDSIWAGDFVNVIGVLDHDRLRRLREATAEVGSGSTRSQLLASIAARLAELGHLESALELLHYIEPEHAVVALRDVVDTMPATDIPRVMDAFRMRTNPFPLWRGERARIWAAFGGRLSELGAVGLSRLLEEWHDRRPTQSEMLVDLIAYGPALIGLGGASIARELTSSLGPETAFAGR